MLLHNKRDYYVYHANGELRLVKSKDVGEAIVKIEGQEPYIVFEVNPRPMKVEIDKGKLSVNKGDDRISYYTALIEYAKLLNVA